jgi:hypothetical protein
MTANLAGIQNNSGNLNTRPVLAEFFSAQIITFKSLAKKIFCKASTTILATCIPDLLLTTNKVKIAPLLQKHLW